MIKIENGRQYISMEVMKYFPKSEGQPWETYFMRVCGQGKYATFDMPNISVDRNKLESFYSTLKDLNQKLEGNWIQSFSHDANFILNVEYDRTGCVKVKAEIYDLPHCESRCEITFTTDQTFISETLHQLERMLLPE